MSTDNHNISKMEYPKDYPVIDGKNPDRVYVGYRKYLDEWKAQYNMLLKDGQTCMDCVNHNTCTTMYGQKSIATACQWYPSRFRNMPVNTPKD